MATIALYANKINQMPGLITDFKKSVSDYNTELANLKKKTLTINTSVCNLDDVINSIQASTQTQEQKIAALDTFKKNSEEFITEVARIDSNVADVVNKRKDDFYKEYYYLKPEIEKEWLEIAADLYVKADQWCKEHWKEILITIVIVIGAILAIAAVICTGGMALVPMLAAGLTALGVSAGTALTIATVVSITVAVIAVTSTLASSTLNIIDTWCDMSGNSTFKSWQTAMNWTSAISNGFYAVGSIFNSFNGISNASLREYSKNYLTNGDFRSAIWNADKFGLTLQPNSSTFWSGLGRDGENIAKQYASDMGRTTLESTLDNAGIKMPEWTSPGGPQAWSSASSSYSIGSSGDATALLGEAVKNTSVWNTTESVLLNINPNITSLTLINNYGTLSQTITFIPRVFEIGSLLSGLFGAWQSAGNVIKEAS